MGNICNILTNKTVEQEKIAIGTPIYSRFDLSNNIYKIDKISYDKNLTENTNSLSRTYSLPNLHNQNIIYIDRYNQPIPTSQIVYYNDTNSIMSGWLTGLLIGDMLDDNI